MLMRSRNVLLYAGGLFMLLLVTAGYSFLAVRADEAETTRVFLPIISLGGSGAVENTPTPTGTATSAVTATVVSTATVSATPTGCSLVDNLLNNGDFESGSENWSLYTSGEATFEITGEAFACANAAQLVLTDVGNNTQFMQRGFELRSGAQYRLTFSATSATPSGLSVFVHQQNAPYENYGLKKSFALTDTWQTYMVEFEASGFNGTTTDTRLRFWFPGQAADGDVIRIDAVRLLEIGGPPPSTPGSSATPTEPPQGQTATPDPTDPPDATATPRPTRTPRPTATPGGGGGGGGGGGRQILALELDRRVTESDRGFPHNTPPVNNFDWTSPVNYANGTFQIRVEIRSQPVAQDMILQLCFWQEEGGNRFQREACTREKRVRGTSGNVVSWSIAVQEIWNKPGNPILWNRPRYRAGLAIKNADGDPVSDFNGWNWNGEDPKKWYPLDMHFRAVVVAPGAQFSGWDSYLNE